MQEGDGVTADVSPLPVITAESTEPLFAWIDDKGEFHVEQKVADVPANARDAVRVADPVKDPAKLDDIFVADLRTRRARRPLSRSRRPVAPTSRRSPPTAGSRGARSSSMDAAAPRAFCPEDRSSPP